MYWGEKKNSVFFVVRLDNISFYILHMLSTICLWQNNNNNNRINNDLRQTIFVLLNHLPKLACTFIYWATNNQKFNYENFIGHFLKWGKKMENNNNKSSRSGSRRLENGLPVAWLCFALLCIIFVFVFVVPNRVFSLFLSLSTPPLCHIEFIVMWLSGSEMYMKQPVANFNRNNGQSTGSQFPSRFYNAHSHTHVFLPFRFVFKWYCMTLVCVCVCVSK